MKKTSMFILLTILVSLLTVVAITYFGIPFFHPVSEGDITKIVKQQMVEDKINETSRVTNLESNVTNALDKIAPSVVTISLQDSFPTTGTTLKKGGASGIIITKDGYILTNKHAVQSQENGVYVVKTSEGALYRVDTIRDDPVLDIAILHIATSSGGIPTDLVSASFVSYKSTTRIGQFVLSLGNIENQDEASATLGIISAINRTLNTPPTSDTYIGLYQTDAALQEGNSGGPLVNVAGDVIGVATAKSPAGANVGYAIPITSEYITATLAGIDMQINANISGNIAMSSGIALQLSNTTKAKKSNANSTVRYSIPRPQIGGVITNLTKEIAKTNNYAKFEGYYVKSVTPGTPIEKTGLISGDIITEINGINVNNTLPFLYALFMYKPGDNISCTLFRNKEYKTIEIQTVLYQPE